MLIIRPEVVHLLLLLLSVPLQYALLRYGTVYEKEALVTIKSSWEYLKDYYKYLNEYESKENDDNIKDDSLEEVIDTKKIRNHRPDNLFYRIGQVVVHTDHAYIGIIIGWTVNKEDIGDEPIYEVLINEQNTPRVIKANQSSLVVFDYAQVMVYDIDKYFESFDGMLYKPKSWLRAYYPID